MIQISIKKSFFRILLFFLLILSNPFGALTWYAENFRFWGESNWARSIDYATQWLRQMNFNCVCWTLISWCVVTSHAVTRSIFEQVFFLCLKKKWKREKFTKPKWKNTYKNRYNETRKKKKEEKDRSCLNSKRLWSGKRTQWLWHMKRIHMRLWVYFFHSCARSLAHTRTQWLIQKWMNIVKFFFVFKLIMLKKNLGGAKHDVILMSIIDLFFSGRLDSADITLFSTFLIALHRSCSSASFLFHRPFRAALYLYECVYLNVRFYRFILIGHYLWVLMCWFVSNWTTHYPISHSVCCSVRVRRNKWKWLKPF